MQAQVPAPDEAQGRRSRHRSYARATIACALALTAVLGCTTRPDLQFSPSTLPDAHVGSPYSATITVGQAVTPVGGASIQDGALPPGLSLALVEDQPDTILISGTPTATGTYNVTIYVWCYGTNVSGQRGTKTYTLAVK